MDQKDKTPCTRCGWPKSDHILRLDTDADTLRTRMRVREGYSTTLLCQDGSYRCPGFRSEEVVGFTEVPVTVHEKKKKFALGGWLDWLQITFGTLKV